ncbi:OLC1v1006978C1 [Oldenlandia corymbosa var. corymbosa]|uniref:OLC1v1006978C1 n=1 Tax=Oldenlandia corymbosa var. corymbosa TaxID=529605 RepID=A0AAV1DI99_OLDCO|nr:OLC1v1006978C1 [Oldenlandia corymbosa var. corymbosa]
MATRNFVLTLVFCVFLFGFVVAQPPLNKAEQEAVYGVLESINSAVPWRSVFPDDFCSSAPHGVVCDYLDDDQGGVSAHITELSFGYVSDYSPNPLCAPNATLNGSLFSRFTHLTKLFFYRCFNGKSVSFPDFSSLGSSLEDLVFIENPSLVGSIGRNISNLKSVRKLILTGTNVGGKIPVGIEDLTGLEQLTLSRNNFSGEVFVNFGKLKNLKVLDLSQNQLVGNVPGTLGNGSTELLKLDLSFNGFSGEIPESLKALKSLEFLDLSYNRFGNFGVPLFLGEMSSLKEVYLNGNFLGGRIPEIWKNLGSILGLGLSNNGLVGSIPASMAVNLRNLCYLGLDNNKLEGTVPEEFSSLESVNELNFENNNLSGKVPFTANFVAQIGTKLKLQGNPELCVEDELKSNQFSVATTSLVQLKLCNKKPIVPQYAIFHGDSAPQAHNSHLWLLVSIGFLLLFSL